MSWFFNTKRRTRVERGLLIPHDNAAIADAAAKPDAPATTARVPMLRPTMALVVVSVVCVALITQGAQLLGARFAQPASPVLVASDTWPYQNNTLTVGPNSRFADYSQFIATQDRLRQAHPQLVSIDAKHNTLTVFRDQQAVLEATIRARADAASWRHVPAGYYEVAAVRDERYSSLEQVYYSDTLELNHRTAIHGPARTNDGTPTTAAPLGVQVSAADASALATLVPVGTPVLVHTSATSTATEPLTPHGPELDVRGYLVRDIDTNDTLAAFRAEAVVPIASLTKLMTALVVAEEYDLEGEIVINPERHATTLVPRLANARQTTVYELLQLLLLESSNEAAEVLAADIGREAFIKMMNARADALGLRQSTFTDPSGLDDGNQSSASDLYQLTQYMYQNYPFLLRMTVDETLVSATRESDFVGLENFNLVKGLDTLVGGKIGETQAAQQTSVTVHELSFGEETRPVIIVVLGSGARSQDVTRLHNYVQTRYGDD